jgi:pilus assembly protein TadC
MKNDRNLNQKQLKFFIDQMARKVRRGGGLSSTLNVTASGVSSGQSAKANDGESGATV